MTARHEAGSAELDDLACGLSRRRQRKRQGRVTEAPAHMPGSLAPNLMSKFEGHGAAIHQLKSLQCRRTDQK